MTFSVKEVLYVLEVIRKRQDYRSASDLLMEFLNVYDALGDEKQKVYNKYEVPADETLFNEVAYRNETRKIESTYYSYLLPIYNKMTHPSEKEIAFIFLMNVEKNQEFFNADNELDYFHQIPYMLRSYLAFSLVALTGLGAEEVLKIYNSEPTNHYDNYNEYAEERDYEGDYDCYGDDYDDY